MTAQWVVSKKAGLWTLDWTRGLDCELDVGRKLFPCHKQGVNV